MTEVHPACVWVTRPEPGLQRLCSAIGAVGFRAVAVPTLEIAPPADPGTLAKHARSGLARARVAVFVSRNAVDWLWRLLGTDTAAILTQCDVVAVGPATAAALQARRIERVIAPDSGADSEALLALPQLGETAIAGCEVAIVRGRGGRELLADTLRHRGARVTCIEVYVRQQCAETGHRLPALWRDHEPAAIVVSSPAGLEALVAMTAAEHRPKLMASRLVCLGRRLPEQARALGFENCIPADATAGDEGIVRTLQARLGKPTAREANDR